MAALRSKWGHYIFVLFLSSFFFFFSLLNRSRGRLDVCHTSTHGVALVRIEDAGLKRAACGSMKYRTQKWRKNRHLGTIAQLCRPISSQLKHVSTIEKTFKQQYFHISSRYGELLPTSGCDRFVSLGHPSKFQRVSRLVLLSFFFFFFFVFLA